MESLEEINARLKDAAVALHLAEVKGPVTDKLRGSNFMKALGGEVFLSNYDAWRSLHQEETSLAQAANTQQTHQTKE